MTRTARSHLPWLEALSLVIVLLAVLIPRVNGLDRLVAVDEANWLARSANFYKALGRGQFANTFQSEHPGVAVMWAGTAGHLWRFPDYLFTSGGQIDRYRHPGLLQQTGHSFLELLVAGEIVVVLINTVALVLALIFARRILGPLPAFIGFLLIAFDPFHTALSRFLHPDGLLSSLLLLALLAFLSFLHRHKVSDLLVSGAAAGLSWLTKSPGLFLAPAVVLISAIDAWRNRPPHKAGHLRWQLWQFAWPLLVWGLAALAIFVALWPAMWVDPVGTVSRVVVEAMKYASEGHSSQTFFNGQLYPDGQITTPIFYPISYLWRSTPVVLLGIVAACVAFISKREPLTSLRTRRATMGLVLFVLVFTVLQNVGTKKFDRYLLPVFPPLDLVAAVGWVAVVAWLRSRRLVPFRRFAPYLLVGASLVLQAIGTLRTYPYYLSYYNPLLGGSARAPEVMAIGWGEGLDQAANYLNEKPNAHNLQVLTWHETSLYPFFSGTTWSIPGRSTISDEGLQWMLSLHYAVIYANEWQRRLPEELLDYLAQKTPEHTIWINGLEYVRVYKLISVPQAPPPSQLVENGNLGGLARLVGYDPAPPLQATVGATLPLTLTWEALGAFEEDYTVFIHLAAADKVPLAQVDSQPLAGAYATTFWEVGQRLADPYLLAIPPDLPPGEYELLVGMYLASTGARLPMLTQDGSVVGDSISLGFVEVSAP
jgi:hypothetical protein